MKITEQRVILTVLALALGFGFTGREGTAGLVTNYSDVCGHVKYQSATYTSFQSVFENFYDSFLGGQIWRGVVEFGIAAFPTNPLSPIRLIMKVTVSASGNTNYAFNLVSYTNANGAVNTNDYGCAATLVGTLCSNILPVVGQVFTSDVTAVIQAARTNGLTNIGFRVQTDPDSSSDLDLRFNDAQNGEGMRLEWSPNFPMINNNGGASGVTTSAATLNGILTATGAAPAYVVVYWGTNDGGTNVASWGMTNAMGARDEGSFSTNISGLITNTVYYYRCFASNSYGLAWAAASTNFTTLAGPIPGSLRFSASTSAVNENAGTVAISVIRTGGSNGVASVNYATGNGTALAGTEYTATNGTLSWADNDASNKTVTVAIVDNSEYGTNKTFSVILTNAVSATLGAPATATVTIVENDSLPTPGTLQFSAATASVAENAGSIILVVTRASGSDGTAAVHYATADGTAASGSNYLAGSGTVAWLDGDAADKTITVNILDNSVYEGDRNFSVSLSSPGGAVLGAPATATVTIAENEAPPNPPDPPTGVTASDGTYVDKIRVTWSPVTNASYYEIWGGTNLDQLTFIKQQFILTGAKFDDTNTQALITYYYRLKSSNSVGSGSFSAADTGWRRVSVTRLAADFDGDRLADPAAYVSGNWYAWLSVLGYQRVGPYPFGSASATPVAADFDGDHLADPAVYDGTNWTEWLSGSSYAAAGPYPYSVSGMSALAADFDGDGKADPTGWVLGNWYAWFSSLGYVQLGPVPLGATMAAPVAADLDGDGVGDVAVYSPMNWSEWRSGSAYAEVGPYPYGVGGGLPLAADFDGDGLADPAAVATNDWTVWLSTAGYTKYGPYPLPVSP